MKVLIVGSNSVHVSSYINHLKTISQEVYLLAEEECNFLEVKEEFQVNFRRLNPLSIIANYRKTKRLIQQLSPTVIHIHQVNRLAYMVTRIAAKLAIPVVTTAWGSDVLVIPSQNKLFRFLVKKTLERSAFVTADSQDMIAAMQRLVPSKEKYIHLQYGIELVPPTTKEKLIFSNRIHKPLYRIDQIIRYFEEMNTDYPDWSLVIGAIGTETETLKHQVVTAGLEKRVIFTDWLEKTENHAWYGRSMIYISIPSSDGTAVSLLEAMSAGCVPVVPDLAVSHEWIIDGETGVIEKEGVNPLREAMRIDQASCAEKNREKVSKVASRSACMERFKELYQKAVDNG